MEKEQKSNEKENVVIDDFDFSLIADFSRESNDKVPEGTRKRGLRQVLFLLSAGI